MRIATCCWAFLLLAGEIVWGQQELVTLTMTERANVARHGEWVTIGIPLPKGAVKSTDTLCLVQNGATIPAEILPVSRWPGDGSLRWVHLVFQSDCPAGGTSRVTVACAPVAAIQKRVDVKDAADRFVVSTGPLAFEVRKHGFNLIDKATAGAERLIDGHARGLGVRVEGEEYLAVHDRDVCVTLEDNGPLHVVLRAAGSLKNAAAEKVDFDCRLIAYAGCAEVKIVVTLVNRQGGTAEFIPLEAFFLELPTTVQQGKCLFGTETGELIEGSLVDRTEAYVYQSSSDEHVFGGAVKGSGGGKQSKPNTLGWAALSDGSRTVAAGVRWFWQLHPKSIELSAECLLRVGLYPQRHPKPLNVYSGVARTHELRLSFDAGPEDGRRLKSCFAALQKPLRPFAPPKWYCRDTRALGDYCEAGGEELYGPFAGQVKRFDEAFEQANRRCQAFRDRRRIKSVETDSYGLLNYGDGVHHVWTSGVDVPENVAWDGNYYGYPHMMCVQFLRTGNLEYFDNFAAHALHVGDVHTVHHAERSELIGGCRYCPPTDHVRIDPTNWSDYRTAKVYVSDLFNHHKVAGVIDRWYLLRDHRCRDVAEMVLDYCYRWKYGDNDYGQPRGPGMILDFCYQGYLLTGDEKWIRRAANVLRVHKGRPLKLSFQAGIFLEGMRKYYEISGDEEAFDYIKQSIERLIAENRGGGTTAQAHSFMYLKTREKKYLEAALANLPQSGNFGNPWKDYALSMRNAAMCIGDLHRAASRTP